MCSNISYFIYDFLLLRLRPHFRVHTVSMIYKNKHAICQGIMSNSQTGTYCIDIWLALPRKNSILDRIIKRNSCHIPQKTAIIWNDITFIHVRGVCICQFCHLPIHFLSQHCLQIWSKLHFRCYNISSCTYQQNKNLWNLFERYCT